MKPPFEWDEYSDQPRQLKDRAYKKRMRRMQSRSLLKSALAGIVWIPLAVAAMPFLQKRHSETEALPGLVVDPLRDPEAAIDALKELGVKELLIRIPMWEAHRLDAVLAFLKRCEGRRFFFVLMQDRDHVENAVQRAETLLRLFAALSPYGTRFQIGTTLNRAKWGFFSVDEYLTFFKTAQQLRDEAFPQIELTGPGVIDFEYHFAAHALFNLSGVRFDGVTSLLYVDRRGAPENTQAGCDLPCKINLLSALEMLSPKAKGPLYLTETNWPLTGTEPYAPTSEKECVDEEAHASYLVRYFLLALATQQVRTVYWHQLIAPGYGLIDNRDGIRKRPAFYALKTLIGMIGDARYISLQQRRERFEMLLEKPGGLLRIFWMNGKEETQYFAQKRRFTDRDGRAFEAESITVGDAPVYLYEEDGA
jgi:hypothetical protein